MKSLLKSILAAILVCSVIGGLYIGAYALHDCKNYPSKCY